MTSAPMPDNSKHPHLTAEELAEFREIFNLVDLDKGGTISKDELKQLMQTLGLKPTGRLRKLPSKAWPVAGILVIASILRLLHLCQTVGELAR